MPRTSRTSRLIASAALTALAALTTPAAASALTHFAAPTNQGTHDCLSAENACELPKALEGSPNEVLLAHGQYGTQAAPLAALKVSSPTYITGPSRYPLPLIFIGTSGITLENPGAILDGIEVDEGAGAYLGVDLIGALMDQDIVNGGAPCVGFSGTIRNSLCHSTFPGSTGALYANGSTGSPATLTLRNDTLIGSGGANAVYVNLSGGSPVAFDFTNVIARGPGGTVPDIFAQASGTTAALTFHYSNYGTVLAEGGATITPPGSPTNQTVEPLFAEHYEEGRGSPTIRAGITEEADGPYALNGAKRAIGDEWTCNFETPSTYPPNGPLRQHEIEGPVATDIGAYEYVPEDNLPCPPPEFLYIPNTKITKTKINRREAALSISFGSFEEWKRASGFECQLTEPRRKHGKRPKAAFSACTSPKTYRHLSPGKYRFEVRGFNSKGTDPTPATVTATIKPPWRS